MEPKIQEIEDLPEEQEHAEPKSVAEEPAKEVEATAGGEQPAPRRIVLAPNELLERLAAQLRNSKVSGSAEARLARRFVDALPFSFLGCQHRREGFLSAAECAQVLRDMEAVPFKEATVLKGSGDPAAGGAASVPIPAIRRSQVKWVPRTEQWVWLYERFFDEVVQANNQLWAFDLTGFGDEIQLTRYEGGDQGHYGWHRDCGDRASSNRKISAVVQLSPPEDYEGGHLQFMQGGGPTSEGRAQGSVVVFPSFEAHCVTPVTSGTRYSLVIWVKGPPFR